MVNASGAGGETSGGGGGGIIKVVSNSPSGTTDLSEGLASAALASEPEMFAMLGSMITANVMTTWWRWRDAGIE
ncbi:MAG: hypothetical protein ABIY55_22370 [Kofleriaceae bacterium]